MITFSYQLTSYQHFLESFARFLGTDISNGEMQIPKTMGEGFMRTFSFEGFDALLYDFKMNQDLLMRREKDDVEFYTLNYDYLDNPEGAQIVLEGEIANAGAHTQTYFYLVSFLHSLDSLLYKDVTLKGIRIFMPMSWMCKYLHVQEKEEVLAQYVRMKAAGVWQKPIDAEIRSLTADLLADGDRNLLFYQNKVMRLVELFFDWLYHEMQSHPGKPLSRGDILTARRIEALLTEDVTVLPPTIREMSRQFALSESKLKKVFKTVFGLPPYEYYQKHRMQKARQLLLSGNYAIKDVGYTLGYSNLSNFTLAFKKEFGKLPSEVVREGK